MAVFEEIADRGIPQLAPAPHARANLERLQRLSKPFGIRIVVEDDVGLISLRLELAAMDHGKSEGNELVRDASSYLFDVCARSRDRGVY